VADQAEAGYRDRRTTLEYGRELTSAARIPSGDLVILLEVCTGALARIRAPWRHAGLERLQELGQGLGEGFLKSCIRMMPLRACDLRITLHHG